MKTPSRRQKLNRNTMKEMERFLREKDAELNGSIRSLMTHRGITEGIHSADMLDWATETVQDKIQVALIDHLKPQVIQIRAALERLARGEYGFCRDCRNFIGIPRLRALPFAQRCTPCQSLAERQPGRVSQVLAAA